MTPDDSTPPPAAPHVEWLYHNGREVKGPMSTAQLFAAARLRRVTANTRVALASENVWHHAGEFEGLIPSDHPATSAASSNTPRNVRHHATPTASTQAMREALRYLHEQDLRRAGPSAARVVSTGDSLGPAVGRLMRSGGDILRSLLERALGGVFTLATRSMHSRVVLGCVTVCVIGWVVYSIPRDGISQQEAHAALQQMVNEFRELRAARADTTQWENFSQRTRSELAELVPKLESSARVEDPASLQLLWIARDYFPKMLADSREAPGVTEQQLDAQLTGLTQKTVHPQSKSIVFESAAVGIIGLDVLVVLAGGLWWWRRSHER